MHWFYILTTQSKISILISLFFCIAIFTIVLLPATDKSFVFIEYKCANYTKYFALNRIMNTFAVMIGLDDEVKIRPLNIAGFFTCFLGKIFFLLIIGNILLKQLLSKINVD
ncbi:hypothetical protein GCM10022406_41820 [Hymenobacter algoricola]|uniref:Uncharacterized protein n=1 Tax=Hymenobacter algoricola TaxID=486267 RepID=A0ABP7NXM4_9BACT